MAWAPEGEGKKRRGRAVPDVGAAGAVPDVEDAVPDTVPDIRADSGADTPGTVIIRASPGRARAGSTRRDAVPDDPAADAVPDDPAAAASREIPAASAATTRKLK